MMREALQSLARVSSRSTRPLADLLPYLMCGTIGDFGPVHLLQDGSIGYAVEFDVPVVDTRIDGEAWISGLIDQALRALPHEVQWQWFVLSSSYVEPQLQHYLSQPGHDLTGQACVEHFLRRWRDAQHAGFFPSERNINFFPRSQTILIALKSAPGCLGHDVPPLRLASGRSLAQSTASFIDAARALLSGFTACGMAPVALGADRLANLVAQLLFPWRRFERPAIVTGLHSVREAVASLGRIESIEPAGFCTQCAGRPAFHRVASMLWHPRAVRPGMLNELMLMRPCLSISVSGAALASAASAVRLKAQGLVNARSANRFNEVESQARAQALADVERRLFAEGEKLVEGRLQVHLIEASEQAADEAARCVCDFLRDQDMEADVEDDIGSSLILRGCLPFTVYEATERKLRRRRRFLSRDFADIHPAGGGWTGFDPRRGDTAAASPIVMYSNPAGEPLFVDPTRAERNPHALVVGQSGSGKSFFVHDYLLHLWRLPSVRLYLVSIKPDYRKLALLLGRYVELNLDCAESLNPFGGAPTAENQARWVAALTLMLTEGRADRPLTRDQEIALQEASLAASAQNWDADARQAMAQTQLDDVCVQLERRAGALGRDLAFALLPYRRGPYRRLFNGPRTLGPADRFVFFNLGGILRQPCSAAACFCVFNLIDEVMHDPALRAAPKGLIADEAWALVQNPFAAAILERSLKAYRSLGGFALPIVQDPRDLDTPAGRVMLVNTATKIVLPMDRSGQDDLARYVRLNERELDLVRNLRLVKRRYSEFFVSIEGIHSTKGLLIPDPFRYAIATTDPADEAQLDRLHRETGSMLTAVQRFAREMPYGVARDTGSCLAERGIARARWLLLLALLAAAVVAYLATGSRQAPAAAPIPIPMLPQKITEQALGLLEPDIGVQRAGPIVAPYSAPTSSGGRAAPILANPPLAAAAGAQRRRASEPRPPIPDLIESTAPGDEPSDPLASMSLQADLLEVAPEAADLILVEIRASSGKLLARLRPASGGEPSAGAWFETGDAPAPGWTVVDLQADRVTLMSSQGQRVRLAVQPPGADAAAEATAASWMPPGR